jgi:peptide/nickel transport system substrate-binding protein
MEKYRWQLIIILITGLVVGIILVIQQGNPLTSPDGSTQPVSGGIYTEALVGEFQRLNPFLDRYNQPDQDIDRLLFSGLVKFDNSGMAQPDLAETWGISQDGSIYNFTLRPDLYWHDGQPITTSDVAFTVGLIKSENALIPADLRKFWSEITVNVLNKNQIQFALPESFSPFLDYLSFGILPEHLLGGLTLDGIIDHPFNLAPIGSGPFKFDRLLITDNKISGVVLRASETYYGGKPFLEEVVFKYFPTVDDAWSAYKGGDVEGLSSISGDILDEVLVDPNLNLYSAPEPTLTMIFLNLDNSKVKFLQEPNFRKALLMAINRQSLISQFYAGQAVVVDGPILPGNWAYYADLARVEYSPEFAQQELTKLGYTIAEDGFTLTSSDGATIQLELLCPDTELHQMIAERIKDDWSSLGLQVDLIIKPYDEVIADLESRDYQAALIDIDLSGSPDPDPYPFWAQSQIQSGQNYSQWDNRTASEYLEQARISLITSDRERLYRNFQVIFQQELPSLPLFSPIFNYAVTSKLKGISLGPFYNMSDRFYTISSWYILAEETQNNE